MMAVMAIATVAAFLVSYILGKKAENNAQILKYSVGSDYAVYAVLG